MRQGALTAVGTSCVPCVPTSLVMASLCSAGIHTGITDPATEVRCYLF